VRAVIIGNSATAVGAIESLRQTDQLAEVVVISEESHLIYSRPLLDHYLGGAIGADQLSYRDGDFYTQHNVMAVLDCSVVRIDTDAHAVATSRGETFVYDKLLIATGGVPIVPPVPGIETEGVHTFARLADAKAIDAQLAAGHVRRAVVVGGGMIGIKATDALIKRHTSVTMLELAPRILSAALDDTGSGMMANLLADAGVQVLVEDTVEHINSIRGHLSSVTLRSGQEVPCELLVFGIGVRPNSGLAKEAGIQVNRGIVVDEYMRTSADDVYAAGDVAEAYDLVVDMNRTVAIWPNAYRQGAIAGAHMVGLDRPDRGGVAMNVIEVCGIPAISVGNGNVEGDEYKVLADLTEREHRYKRLVLKDGRLVGVILIGQIDRAGIYTGLIRNRTLLGEAGEKLLGANISLLSLPDQYRKHVVTGAGIEV